MSAQGNEPQSSTEPSLFHRFAALSHLRPDSIQDDSGQDLVEYALIAALIGLAAVTSAHGVAVSVSSTINIVGSSLTSSL